MQTLDYQVPRSGKSIPATVWFLIALPLLSGGWAFLSAANWGAEPFGVVQLVDVVLFFGAPVAALVCAIAWCFIARKRRLPRRLFGLALAWFALMTYWSIGSLLPYFQEPWNT